MITRTWTKAEYYRLGELGFFRGQRVELIAGHILELGLPPPPHATALMLAAHALAHFQPTCHVQTRMPLNLGATTEPEPDVAVVVGQVRDYATAHPTHAVLVVEVGDALLAYNRGGKASLYASAAILEYWVVNLVDRQVEIYRDPVPDANEPFGHRYSVRVDRLPGETLSPLALPSAVLAVDDLLP